MKLVTVVGARPQFIKAAALSKVVAESERVSEVLVHTGQHFDKDMSDAFFSELSLSQPKYNLGIGGLSHAAMTGRMMERLEEIYEEEQPDWVVVFGDTNSTLAAAISASKLSLKIAHIEAGLRSGNFAMPEEQNRVLTDRLSSLLLCPTETGVSNLYTEGYPYTDSTGATQRISNVGDVMHDLYLQSDLRNSFSTPLILDCGTPLPSEYVVCTIHRQENTDCPKVLSELLRAIRAISETIPVIMVVHPRLRSQVDNQSLSELLSKFIMLTPRPYGEMQRLLRFAAAVITDSGGLQKEAYFHNIPCVTVRPETEWRETVAAGANVLAEPSRESIHEALDVAMRLELWPPLYGNGDAAKKILAELLEN